MTWFMCICIKHETKFHSLLKDFKTHLSIECIASIIKYAESLYDKEKYLSNHHCKYVINCMDSVTTSPLESENQIIHGHLGIQSNLNIDKGIERMTEYSHKKGNENKNISLQNLEQKNLSSCVHTS